jgi:hypothetical protein
MSKLAAAEYDDETFLCSHRLEEVAAKIIERETGRYPIVPASEYVCPTCRDCGVFPGTGAAWASCLCEAGRLRCEGGSDCPSAFDDEPRASGIVRVRR